MLALSVGFFRGTVVPYGATRCSPDFAVTGHLSSDAANKSALDAALRLRHSGESKN